MFFIGFVAGGTAGILIMALMVGAKRNEVSTQDLVRELETRQGVEKISSGPFRGYEIKKKYTNDRAQIIADTVLIIDGKEEATQEYQEEQLKREKYKNP